MKELRVEMEEKLGRNETWLAENGGEGIHEEVKAKLKESQWEWAQLKIQKRTQREMRKLAKWSIIFFN